MLAQHAVERISVDIADGRVGLQFHSAVQTVQIDGGDYGIFLLTAGLALHYGSEYGGLVWSKSLQTGLLHALLRPEGIVFATQTGKYFVYGSGPPELIVVREYYGEEVGAVNSVFRKEVIVPQGIVNSGGIHHHLSGDELHHPFPAAYGS